MSNKVVIVNLDRPRELRFGHKAIKTLIAMTGRTLENLVDFSNGINLEEAEIFLYCGLLSDAQANGETLDFENIEALLDKGNFTENITKMTEAINIAFYSESDTESGKKKRVAAEK